MKKIDNYFTHLHFTFFHQAVVDAQASKITLPQYSSGVSKN